MFLVEPRQPDQLLPPPQGRLCRLRQPHAVVQVADADGGFLAVGAQALQGVLANRMQHDVTRFAAGARLMRDEAFVHQRGQAVEHVDFGFWILDFGLGRWEGRRRLRLRRLS